MSETKKFCVYCFDEARENLTHSHLFPKALGGRVADYYTCRECNNAIGASIEGSIKRNVTLAQLIEKVGIQEKEDAFRDLRITHERTGERAHYNGNILSAKVTYQKFPRKWSGGKKAVEKQLLARVKKRCPNWVDHVREQIRRGDKVINVCGERYRRNVERSEESYVMTGGDFPTPVLAKIAYEACCVFGQYIPDVLTDFANATLKVDRNQSGPGRIVVSCDFYKRVRLLGVTDDALRGRVDVSELRAKPFHLLGFGEGPDRICYVLIVLFDCLTFVVPIGKASDKTVLREELLDKLLMFDSLDGSIDTYEYPDDHLKLIRISAKVGWDLYQAKV